MKKYLFYMLLEKMRSNPNFKKKIKILFIASMVSFVFLAGGIIWAGMSLYRIAAQQVNAIQFDQPVKGIETSLKSVPALTTADCLSKLQSYLNIEPWLTKPISENWQSIRGACSSSKVNSCQGSSCKEINIKVNSQDKEAFI